MLNNKAKILVITDILMNSNIVLEAYKKIFGNQYPGIDLNLLEWDIGDVERLRIEILKNEKNGIDKASFPEKLISLIPDIDIFITHVCPVNDLVLSKAKRLKIIGCARSCCDNIDTSALMGKDVTILYSPLSKIETLADSTIGMIISECRNIARSHKKMMDGYWDMDFVIKGSSRNLSNSTVGIIGFGNAGRAVAERLRGFNVRLLVYDPYIKKDEIERFEARSADLKVLLTESDFIILLARVNKTAGHIIGYNEFKLMKKTAYFINTARAGLVNYDALRQSLQEKRIAGAALDVFESEPIDKRDPLLHMDNVTLTPHVAGISKQAYYDAISEVFKDIVNIINGRKPRYQYFIGKN